MTLGHMLAQIFKQCTVWTTKEININKTENATNPRNSSWKMFRLRDFFFHETIIFFPILLQYGSDAEGGFVRKKRNLAWLIWMIYVLIIRKTQGGKTWKTYYWIQLFMSAKFRVQLKHSPSFSRVSLILIHVGHEPHKIFVQKNIFRGNRQ